MLNKRLFLTLMLLGALAIPAHAKTSGVDEIKGLSKQPVPAVALNTNEAITTNSWAYKTLRTLYGKYGGVMEIPQEKLNGTGSLTRNEAALILVNLLGKIEKDKIQLSELEKERVDALNDQLKAEIGELTARISRVESTVDSLQGSVSNLEEKQGKSWGINFGENHKLGAVFAANYIHGMRKGADDSRFGVPLMDIYMTGKLANHLDYFLYIDPSKEVYEGYSRDIIERGYVSTDIIPHHKVKIGKQPVPILKDNLLFYGALDTTFYNQITTYIAKTQREIGVNISAEHKYLDYQVGIFNKSKHNDNGFVDSGTNGVAFCGWAAVKPLADFPQLGQLELGSGYYTTQNQTAYTPLANYTPNGNFTGKSKDMYTAYARYKLNRFELKGEYLKSHNNLVSAAITGTNGILATTTPTWGNSSGFYLQGSYFIKPQKLQFLAKMDQYDRGIGAKDTIRNYSATLNYYLKYPNVRVLSGYSFIDDQAAKNQNRLELMTVFTL